MTRPRLTSFALHAAFAGLAAGATLLTGCPSDQASATEKNACNGADGCSSKDEKKNEANGCNGHDGKAAEGTQEKNACKGHEAPKANS